jgi:hypothetical protein
MQTIKIEEQLRSAALLLSKFLVVFLAEFVEQVLAKM